MNDTLFIDDLAFELRFSDKRKTIGITVGRMGELIISAPSECPHEVLEEVAREKYRWVHHKLAQKEMIFGTPPEKEFVDGEGFYYLGRSYRLLLIQMEPADTTTPPINLYRDRFLLREDEVVRGEEHFINWYIVQGREWLQERVNAFVNIVDAKPNGIRVQPLGYLWGSCGRNNVLYFHWRTILVPTPIIV